MYTATILLCCSFGILFVSTEVEGNPGPQKNYHDACRFGKVKGSSVPTSDSTAAKMLAAALHIKHITLMELHDIEKETNTAGNIYNFDISARQFDDTIRCCVSIQENTYKRKTNCPRNS